MKTWIAIFSIFSSSFLFAQDKAHYETIFIKANEAYTAENIEEAKDLYEQLISAGINSSEVYYNAANCYYRLKSYPTSILYYEKALKVDPTNKDIKFNLDIANQFITDKIEALPTIFYVNWWNNIVNLSNLSNWTNLSILLSILLAAAIILYLFINIEQLKKLGFYLSVLLSLSLLIAFLAANSAKNKLLSNNTAIVFAPSLNVKSAPAGNSANLFVIHEGIKVNTLKQKGNWIEISLQDGNIGWIEKVAIINI